MSIILDTLLDAVTVTGPGPTVTIESTAYRLHTAIVTASGTNPVATVAIEISHDEINWAPATTPLSFTGAESQSVTFEAAAKYLRANVTALSGNPDRTVSATVSSG